jgi:hypothetical protein
MADLKVSKTQHCRVEVSQKDFLEWVSSKVGKDVSGANIYLPSGVHLLHNEVKYTPPAIIVSWTEKVQNELP